MVRLTKYNIAICLVVAWGGFSYGFGFAVFVTSIGQPGFYKYFNLDREYSPSFDGYTLILSSYQYLYCEASLSTPQPKLAC